MGLSKYDEIPQFARDFLNYLEVIKGKSHNTTNEYFFDLRTFLKFIKLHKGLVNNKTEFEKIVVSDMDINVIKEITLSDLYEFLSYLNRDRLNSASARARKVSCLKSFFKYLNTKTNQINTNPAKELDSPKIKKSLPKYLELEESIKLLGSIDGEFKERDYAIITLFLNCGLRLSELVGINIKDLRKDTLYVVGKGNKERTIYLNEACLFAIDRYLAKRPKDGVIDRNALFLSKRKKRISNKTVQYLVKKYLEQSGLDATKYSTHKLRHTAATLMYKYGNVDVRLLQEILGHENLSTTEIYTHIDNEQLKKAASKNPLSQIKN